MQRGAHIENCNKDRSTHGQCKQGQDQTSAAAERVPQRDDEGPREVDSPRSEDSRRADHHPVKPANTRFMLTVRLILVPGQVAAESTQNRDA